MSNSLILYVGEQEAGQTFAAAAEASGDYAYLPENLMQALGMYITYFPQVVVIDMALDYAAEVYEHLRSVDAHPIFLLSDERIRLASIHSLPHGVSADALLDAIARYEEPRRVPNGILHYA